MSVAVISENAARQVWPGQSAIGKRLKWGGIDSDGPWFTIVGVAATTRYRELAQPRASVYLRGGAVRGRREQPGVAAVGAVRASIAGALRERVRELDRNVFILRALPFSDFVAEPLARPRFVVVSRQHLRRHRAAACDRRPLRRDGGVRATVGRARLAFASRSVRMPATCAGWCFGEAARVAGLGIVLGLAGALATGRFVRNMLIGVEPYRRLTLIAAVGVMLVAATAACYFPQRRATRVDPVTLLRAN